MPALQNLDLARYAAAFHQTTLGCIGTLRDVLMRLERLVASKGWSEEALCCTPYGSPGCPDYP